MGCGVHIGSTRHVGHFWPTVPAPGNSEDGEFDGMKMGRGNRSTRRKPATAPFSPPQIPLDQTRARTRAEKSATNRLSYGAVNWLFVPDVGISAGNLGMFPIADENKLLAFWRLKFHIPRKTFSMTGYWIPDIKGVYRRSFIWRLMWRERVSG
jgi:hypothetical protein